jgi:hypothetical protein
MSPAMQDLPGLLGHELRNPLASALTGAMLARDMVDGRDSRAVVLDGVLKDLDCMTSLIDGWLAMARDQQRSVNPNESKSSALRPLFRLWATSSCSSVRLRISVRTPAMAARPRFALQRNTMAVASTFISKTMAVVSTLAMSNASSKSVARAPVARVSACTLSPRRLLHAAEKFAVCRFRVARGSRSLFLERNSLWHEMLTRR